MNRGGIFNTFMEPRDQFQGTDSASLCPGGPVTQPYSSSVPTLLQDVPQNSATQPG
jgi:hypothetical protein